MDDDKPAELDSVARIRHHPRILRRRELAASINARRTDRTGKMSLTRA